MRQGFSVGELVPDRGSSLLERSGEGFRTTSWDTVRNAAARDPEALDDLISRYWSSVYTCLRCRGYPQAAASELTLGFFEDVVVERDLFARADRSRGRLRTLLRAALDNYCIDQQRRRAARGREVPIPQALLDQEDERLGVMSPPGAAAGASFERRWALEMVEEALRRCERHFHALGKAGHWELFRERVLLPASSGNKAPPLAGAGAGCFASPAAAAAAVQVVTRRLAVLLREVVGETVERGEDVEAELREIRRLLG